MGSTDPNQFIFEINVEKVVSTENDSEFESSIDFESI